MLMFKCVSVSVATSMLLQGPGKKWESYDLNKNGKPVRIPMHVKTGDTVVVIAGKDKGKVGEVSKVRARVCKLADKPLPMSRGALGGVIPILAHRLFQCISEAPAHPYKGFVMHNHTA